MSSPQVLRIGMHESLKNARNNFPGLREDFTSAKENLPASSEVFVQERKRLEGPLRELAKTDDDDDVRFSVVDSERQLNTKKDFYAENINKLIEYFDSFFTNFDKILELETGDFFDDAQHNLVNAAAKDLIEVENLICKIFGTEGSDLKEIYERAFALFTPLDHSVRTAPLDKVVRPSENLSRLAQQTLAGARNAGAKSRGLYKDHQRMVSFILRAYLRNMRTSLNLKHSDPELQETLEAFTGIQKDLYKVLADSTGEEILDKLGLTDNQVQDYFSFSNGSSKSVSERFVEGSFEENAKGIQDLLAVDALLTFDQLRQDLKREPSEAEYKARIGEKTNPVARNIRLDLPRNIHSLVKLLTYNSAGRLKKQFDSTANDGQYGFDPDFASAVNAKFHYIEEELTKSNGVIDWEGKENTLLGDFLSDARKKIFSKIGKQGEWAFDLDSQDPLFDLKHAFDNFDLKAMKDSLRNIVERALKTQDIDRKELLSFVYIASMSFNKYIKLNGKTTLRSKAVNGFNRLFFPNKTQETSPRNDFVQT